MSCGLYVSELVNQFTAEHQEHLEIFQLVIETLERLPKAENKDLLLRYLNCTCWKTPATAPNCVNVSPATSSWNR